MSVTHLIATKIAHRKCLRCGLGIFEQSRRAELRLWRSSLELDLHSLLRSSDQREELLSLHTTISISAETTMTVYMRASPQLENHSLLLVLKGMWLSELFESSSGIVSVASGILDIRPRHFALSLHVSFPRSSARALNPAPNS